MTIDLDPAAIDRAASEGAFSGVVAVDAGEERLFERAHGLAHRASGTRVTPDTALAVASGSKAFTALAVLALVERGALRLDQEVRPLLGDDLPTIDARVTVEQLLAHTSGIGDYLDEEGDGEATDFVLTVPVHTLTSAEAFLPAIDGFPAKHAPGERFTYCNAGYVVLALLIERLTGRGFHEAVAELVIGPAGLADTGYPRLDELPAGTAAGYLFAQGDRMNTLHLPVRGNGDGGAFTTAADLHRFWTALFAGRIVRPEAVAEMVRPRSDVPDEGMRYGLGFWLHRTGPHVILEGADAGVSFRSVHLPAAGLTASVLGNTTDGAWPVARVLAAAVDGMR